MLGHRGLLFGHPRPAVAPFTIFDDDAPSKTAEADAGIPQNSGPQLDSLAGSRLAAVAAVICAATKPGRETAPISWVRLRLGLGIIYARRNKPWVRSNCIRPETSSLIQWARQTVCE